KRIGLRFSVEYHLGKLACLQGVSGEQSSRKEVRGRIGQGRDRRQRDGPADVLRKAGVVAVWGCLCRRCRVGDLDFLLLGDVVEATDKLINFFRLAEPLSALLKQAIRAASVSVIEVAVVALLTGLDDAITAKS